MRKKILKSVSLLVIVATMVMSLCLPSFAANGYSWQSVDGAEHYEVSLYDVTAGTYILGPHFK